MVTHGETGLDAKLTDVELHALDGDVREFYVDQRSDKGGATTSDISDMVTLVVPPTLHGRFRFIAMVGFSSTVVVA